MSSPRSITSNGIRITGARAVDLFAKATATQRTPSPDEYLWAARFTARPRIGGGSPLVTILKVIEDLLRGAWDACPALTRDTPISRPAGKLHGFNWDVDGEPGAWRGELLWRHPHPVLSGTPCTTHLILDEQHQRVTIALGVAADGGAAGVRGVVGAGQARSPLLDPLSRQVNLTADYGNGLPSRLEDGEIDRFVRDQLLADARRWPVAVLAPKEGDDGFLVDPDLIARELFGLAPLYVIQRHNGTFKLTDAVGDRRLSVYWGALRVYQPEFSCADAGHEHPLLLRERVDDPAERAALIGRLGKVAAGRLVPFAGIAARRDPVTKVPEKQAESAPPITAPSMPAGVESDAAPSESLERTTAVSALTAVIAALGARVSVLAETISTLTDSNLQLSEEVSRLRTATTIRGSLNAAVDRRLGKIEGLLTSSTTETGAEPEPSVDAAGAAEAEGNLLDVVRMAAGEYEDGLLVLDGAFRSAENSPYLDVERVGAALMGMADVARRRQAGSLGTGMKAAFQELGIDYRSGIADSTSERDRQQYRIRGENGQVYECYEHIALGGGTYDPKYCLRIYFTSRVPSESRFVVGHIGRHFTVNSTS